MFQISKYITDFPPTKFFLAKDKNVQTSFYNFEQYGIENAHAVTHESSLPIFLARINFFCFSFV